MGAKKGKEEAEQWKGRVEGKVDGKFTHPSEPTVKPTGFSTLANMPSVSPKERKKVLKTTKNKSILAVKKVYSFKEKVTTKSLLFCLRL